MMHRVATSLLCAISLLYLCLLTYAFFPLFFGDKAAEANFFAAVLKESEKRDSEPKSHVQMVTDINVFSGAIFVFCNKCESTKAFEHRYYLKPGPFILATALYALCFSFLIFLRPPRNTEDQPIVNQPDTALNNTIAGFRFRARRLRRGAAIALILIVTSLIIGIGIFLSAGYLASAEAISFNPVLNKIELAADSIQRMNSYEAEELGAIKHDLSRIPINLDLSLSERTQRSELLQRTLERLERRLESLPRLGISTDNTSESLKKRIDDLRETQRTLDEKNRWTFTVSSLSTRIGSVLILIFLVQILVNLYRYNIRLAAYYDARADALQLIGGKDESTLNEYIKVLSPETFDFGRQPRSPADNVMNVLKEVLSGKSK